ncbi:MAG: winged helix-turn-helix transcriptional regulator [Parahaliea sp.]
MKYKRFDHMKCSVAQTLDIIGERWSLLIIRDIFFGARRFSQIQRSLGIAKNILSARLNHLVDEGILSRNQAEGSAHTEYRLTRMGLDLQPVLLAMAHWGDHYRPEQEGLRVEFIERKTGKPIRKMAVISAAGETLSALDIKAIPGPAMAGESLGFKG